MIDGVTVIRPFVATSYMWLQLIILILGILVLFGAMYCLSKTHGNWAAVIVTTISAIVVFIGVAGMAFARRCEEVHFDSSVSVEEINENFYIVDVCADGNYLVIPKR